MMGLLDILGLRSDAQSISVQDAHTGQQDGSLIIIDVREPNEWAATGVPIGGIRIALQDPDFIEKVRAASDKAIGKSVAVSCKSGPRAKAAVQLLAKDGMMGLVTVEGGIGAWAQAGLPVD